MLDMLIAFLALLCEAHVNDRRAWTVRTQGT